jgi:hypothetical protein
MFTSILFLQIWIWWQYEFIKGSVIEPFLARLPMSRIWVIPSSTLGPVTGYLDLRKFPQPLKRNAMILSRLFVTNRIWIGE